MEGLAGLCMDRRPGFLHSSGEDTDFGFFGGLREIVFAVLYCD